nr:TadE/TadG family type IV pilus assembly protein [uncultured Shinella sp.]
MFSQHRLCFEMNPTKTEDTETPSTPAVERRWRRARAKGVFRDKSGQSGIEFALLLPLMMLLVAGTVDLGLGLMIRRKVDQIAAITSDIVSQEDAWKSAGVNTVLSGGAAVLKPFDSTNLKIVVSVLDFNKSGTGTVNWSKAYQTTALTAGTTWPDTISKDVIEDGVQLVVTRVDYSAESALTGLLSNLTGIKIYDFTATAIARPRVGNTVTVN